MNYSDKFVLKVNEVYHDVEQKEYENKHPDIFEDEKVRWKKIGRQFINNSKKISLLDIGSGTGFVPLQLGQFMKKKDLFVCSDISSNILNVCKTNVSDKKFKCLFKYLKLNGKKIDLESDTFDYITLNAVLHHVPNFSVLFKDINRLLKANGHLIIGHEPNMSFYTHRLLWPNYRFVSLLFDTKQFALTLLRKFNLFEFTRRVYQRFNQEIKTYNRIVDEVNKGLLKEGVIKTPLTADQMTEIVDIHSPTAGGYHKDRGIDLSGILKNHLPDFEVDYLETYNYLCKASSKNKFTRWYDSLLSKKYPKNGATFFVVLRKVE